MNWCTLSAKKRKVKVTVGGHYCIHVEVSYISQQLCRKSLIVILLLFLFCFFPHMFILFCLQYVLKIGVTWQVTSLSDKAVIITIMLMFSVSDSWRAAHPGVREWNQLLRHCRGVRHRQVSHHPGSRCHECQKIMLLCCACHLLINLSRYNYKRQVNT